MNFKNDRHYILAKNHHFLGTMKINTNRHHSEICVVSNHFNLFQLIPIKIFVQIITHLKYVWKLLLSGFFSSENEKCNETSSIER